MDQAIRLSEIENGSRKSWDYSLDINEFYNKYYAKYLKTANIEPDKESPAYLKISFLDGSYMDMAKAGGIDIIYSPNIKNWKWGYKSFHFIIYYQDVHSYKGIGDLQPYNWSVSKNLTREQLLENCKSNSMYCTMLLQYDNWEFKHDYPEKF